MESWKEINGYEGLYEVSSHGRVRSITRNVRRNGDTSKKLVGRVLKIQHQNNGYCSVCLCRDGVSKYYRVHRLVALAFIPNPENLPEINHKDENKDNNHVDNLEWVSKSANCQYGTRNERAIANRDQTGAKNGMYGKRGGLNPRAKAVCQLSMQGECIKIWPSVVDAARCLKISENYIRRAAKGFFNQACGYKWAYVDNQ